MKVNGVVINGSITHNGEQLEATLETAAMLRREFTRVRLEGWVKLLSIEDLWTNDRAWEFVLEAALSVGSADFANVQLVHPRLPGLELITQRGFRRPFLEFFRFVADDKSACGAALKQRRPVIVRDVTNSPIFVRTPQLEVLLDAGVRAVTSLPLTGCKGDTLGMMSVHYRQSRHDSNGESAHLAALARVIGLALEKNAAGARHRNFPISAGKAQMGCSVSNRI